MATTEQPRVSNPSTPRPSGRWRRRCWPARWKKAGLPTDEHHADVQDEQLMTPPAAMLTTIAGVAAAGALALAGCGGDDSTGTTTSPSRAVDTAQVESGIEKQLSTSAAEVTSVKCPDDVQAEAGATFNCSVTWSNGATGKVKVTQESLNQFTYQPVSGSVQVPGSTVEKSIEQELDKQGAPDAQANCPDTITVKLDTTVTCDLSGAGGQAAGTVTFTFSDASGTVDPSSVETG